MKYLLIFLGLCLFSCNNQTTSNIQPEIKIENGSLTKGEQDSLIMVLSPYLEIDSIVMQNANQTLQMVSEALGDTNGEDDYYRNVLHVDSIIKQCITYAQENEPKQLLDLFDKEKVNIYAHPSNTIEHEKGLHYMILSLYEKYYRPVSERLYAEKMIELYELTLAHIIGLETFGGYHHPDYILLAKVLMNCYADGLNNYDKAIELQKKVCERIEQEEPEGKASELYGYELMELANLYLTNADTLRTDSCLQELRKNPYMEKLLEE
ncbi:hypothetical protein [Parabacteroides sp. An277]|uniref:hypothetical protein n=1 Tax=Parabacteroides sp. An277 TaxID=1965619 RepID=UPI00112005E4|nr:hypothetical protein [Parabacteroides sp. An277]